MSTNPDEWRVAKQVTQETAKEVTAWCGGRLVEEIDALEAGKTSPGINVPTLRGPKRASAGDYVIENFYDEFEVVNEATYNANPIKE